MNSEPEAELFERYPAIFERERNIACGDGWCDPIDACENSCSTAGQSRGCRK